MSVLELRRIFHESICSEIIRVRRKVDRRTNQEILYPNFADGDNISSVEIAWALVHALCADPVHDALSRVANQTIGNRFEQITSHFLLAVFERLHHLRPGRWLFTTDITDIPNFDQYEHLARLETILNTNRELRTFLGSDYIVKPDIVVARFPESDDTINQDEILVDATENLVQLSSLRHVNATSPRPILHASISCKWTIRSDRAQNTRTEALNLIRNRKGRVPHIVAVTAEPLPTRLATLALGTGDLDCVYHFALPELQVAVQAVSNIDQLDMLNTLVEGRRLRDISDLPFDLAI